MECPKCHRIIPDNATVCPHCHKVLSLVCPNCHSVSKNSICEKCGYIILEKCAKCGKLVPTNNEKCKCGLDVKTSIANNECETDEFASVCITFTALKAIRSLLSSQELYSKFLIKLNNLMQSQLNGIDGLIVRYNNSYVINFNKELSFASSVNKAVRLSLKVLNAFSGLNSRLQEELGSPLKISILIQQKRAEDLLTNKLLENNVKPLMLKKCEKKHLKGMEVILDQYTQDCIARDYKTDSLYSLEYNGNTVMYYELMLENYILAPSTADDTTIDIQKRDINHKPDNTINDMFSFKVFDIKAKCQFEKCYVGDLTTKLKPENKIVTLKADKELQIKTSDIIQIYKNMGLTPIYVSCREELSYKPWGFFESIFKQYYDLSIANGLIAPNCDCRNFSRIRDFILGTTQKASTPEDARFAQMELFVKFLMSLKQCVIIVDSFENLDDTSIQTLELYFDKFKKIDTNFVFIANSETAIHSKIKGLLRTPLYTEFFLLKSNVASLLSELKEDATDFIQSFYFEKIKENFAGSKLYFEHAIRYLLDKDVLVSLENKLIIRNNNSVILPKTFEKLVKARLKSLGSFQDASMILAYSVLLGERLDYELLENLGIKNISENAKLLEKSGFTYTHNTSVYINNYSLIRPIIQSSLKKETIEVLAKNLIGKLGKIIDNTTLLRLMDKISMFKEEYLLLWKNSQLSIESGDYDAYLKNCLGFLSIIDYIGENISAEDIENNKKEVFQNILLSLYNYSPAKIYSIENILLMDAINANDNEKIVKLSNLMLQGALISSNYTDALSLLHNILERLEKPELIVDGTINTKFLLLSLVHIEILFNIGDYINCIEIGEKLLKVIKPDILDKIKPESFSMNLFVTHLLDTFKLVGFAKILTLDNNIEQFFVSIKKAFNEELPEQNCLLAIKDFLAGKDYVPSNIENETPFAKIIYLILQELPNLNKDYKVFALNIYQAKLLAADIHQTQLEYICDLLIAYAYAKIGIISKAYYIFNDVLEISENSAIFNTMALSNYLISITKIDSGEIDDALFIISNTLDEIQKYNNQAKVFYAMFEKLYIDIMQKEKKQTANISSELQKLLSVAPNGELSRICKDLDQQSDSKDEKFIQEETPSDKQDDLAELASDFADDNSYSTETHE